MAAIEYNPQALADLDRLFDFVAATNPVAAGSACATILDAVRILERHPLIGRPVRGSLRELVISHGRTGHVALYRVPAAADRVEILAVRHQREAGYSA
jgi:plasmid stabilization system protein ParE